MNDMRKLMEAVRPLLEGAEKLYYYEHYPHYMGTKNSKFAVNISDVDELHDLYLDQKKRELGDDEEPWYMIVSSWDNYAFGEIIQEWPAVRKALETKGFWAGQWEEGSHAISMDSMRDAANEVGKIEAQIKADEFDDDDWGDY